MVVTCITFKNFRESESPTILVNRTLEYKIEKKEQDASSSLPKFFKELNFELISKCEGAAKKSLEAIVEKKEWNRDEVEKYFDEHRKIMYSFETAMKGLF